MFSHFPHYSGSYISHFPTGNSLEFHIFPDLGLVLAHLINFGKSYNVLTKSKTIYSLDLQIYMFITPNFEALFSLSSFYYSPFIDNFDFLKGH